ncbi:MAG: ATP-binding protein [Elusimicrobiota bacterium]
MNLLGSGLFRRFIVALAVLALAPAMFMGWQLVKISRSGIEDAVVELHIKLAEKTAEGVSSYIRNIDDRMLFTLAALQRKGLDWNTRQAFLRSMIESDPDIEQIAILRNGMELIKVYNPELVADSPNKSYANSPIYRMFADVRKRTLVLKARKDQAPRLEIYYPLSEFTEVRVSMLLNSLWSRVSAERVGGSGYAILVGKAGEPLIYPPDRLPGSYRQSLIEWDIVKAALDAKSVGASDYIGPDGVEQVGAYAHVPEISGAVIIQQPKAEAYLAAIQMSRTAIAIIIVVCVAAVAVAVFLARTLTRPLLDLTRTAERISHDQFPEPVVIRTGDELQVFSETFNRMMSRLKSYAEMQVDRLVLEQQKSEAILFSMGDGIVMTDNDGKVQLANRKALNFLGRKTGEKIEGKTFGDILPEGSELLAAITTVSQDPKEAGGEEASIKEVDLSTEDRRLFLRVSSYQLISPSKKNVIGVVTVIQDVTLVKELDSMKEEFLLSITHDLRNPLGSITGFLEFLRKGVAGTLNEQQTSMVDSMIKSSNRLMTMVNNILDVAKMEDQNLAVHFSEASLSAIAQHPIEILGALAQRRGIELVLDPNGDYKAKLDQSQIERVTTNLVGNAIKFAPDDGRIVVHIEDLGEEYRFCVEDNGPGIPASHLEKIFGKFEQVPGQKRGGTGLGLTISKKFVEAHKGRIWVESEYGKGARFYFTIPKGLEQDEEGNVYLGKPAAKDA